MSETKGSETTSVGLGVASDHPCPRDGERLRRQIVGPAEVLLCSRCGGLWISRNDLRSFLTAPSEQWKLPMSPVAGTAPAVLDDTAVCVCPDRAVMSTLTRDGVRVDICPACAAVWLDGGELQELVRRAEEKLQGRMWDTPGTLGGVWEVFSILRKLLGVG